MPEFHFNKSTARYKKLLCLNVASMNPTHQRTIRGCPATQRFPNEGAFSLSLTPEQMP
jgi:hypothetical protein